MKSTTYHPISSRFILILFSHSQLDFSSVFFPWGMCSQVLATLVEGDFLLNYWSLENTVYYSLFVLIKLLNWHTTPVNVFTSVVHVSNSTSVYAYLEKTKLNTFNDIQRTEFRIPFAFYIRQNIPVYTKALNTKLRRKC